MRDMLRPVGFIDDLFDGLMNPMIKTPSMEMMFKGQPTDIKETETEYIIDMDVPGFKKEDISIETKDGFLVVKSSSKKEETSEKENYLLKERKSISFTRSFKLPNNVNISDINAKMEDGILNIVLPKSEVVENSSKITIN